MAASNQHTELGARETTFFPWLKSPEFPGEEEKTRTAALLNVVMLTSMVLTAVLLLGAFAGNNVPGTAKSIGLVWLALLLVGWRAMHSGHVGTVAAARVVLFFIFITAVNISLGTIRTPVASMYVFWVILAGMLFHAPGILIGTSISSLTILGLILAENAGLLPTPNYSVGLTQWVNFTGLFVMTAGMVYHGNRVRDSALTRAHDEIDKRKQTEEELNKLTRAVEQSPTSIMITDLHGTIEYANPRFSAITGYALEEVLGKTPRILKSGETPQQTFEGLWRTLLAGQEWRGEFINRRKDGTTYHESAVISSIKNRAGQVSHYVAVGDDISERKRSEEALRVSEARHRLLADSARDVVWTMAPDGGITYVSPSIEKVRGFTPEEAMRQPLEDIHPPASRALSLDYFNSLFTDMAAGRPLKSFRGELEYHCKDGSTIWTEVMAHPIMSNGALAEIVGVTRDISEHKRLIRELEQAKEAAEIANQALQQANVELAQIATTDALTGMWNRRHFVAMADTLRAQARRQATPLSLLLLDIDHFKSINDRYGHATGDQVLIELSQRIKQAVRDTDVFARWGGEEFVLLLSCCGAAEAMGVAEKLRALVADRPFPVVGAVTISLGVAELHADEPMESLFQRVDVALYQAKAAGRNATRLSDTQGLGQGPGVRPAQLASEPTHLTSTG